MLNGFLLIVIDLCRRHRVPGQVDLVHVVKVAIAHILLAFNELIYTFNCCLNKCRQNTLGWFVPKWYMGPVFWLLTCVVVLDGAELAQERCKAFNLLL
jgi:hypothetical protein